MTTCENIEKKDNKLLAYCYYIFVFGIVLDLCLKGILVDFGAAILFAMPKGKYSIDTVTFINAFVLLGIEIIILVAAFLTKVFMCAKNGIAIYAKNCDMSHFPFKRYLIVSSIISASIALLIVLVYIFRSFDSVSIIVGVLISLCVLVGLFAGLLLMFFISYKVANANQIDKNKKSIAEPNEIN